MLEKRQNWKGVVKISTERIRSVSTLRATTDRPIEKMYLRNNYMFVVLHVRPICGCVLHARTHIL